MRHFSTNNQLITISKLERAINFMRFACDAKKFKSFANKENILAMRTDLPYVFSKTDTKNTYFFLNREYAKLGERKHTEEPISPLHHFKLTRRQLASLVFPGTYGALYNDKNAPWLSRNFARAYLDRLQLLRSYFPD